MTDIIHKVTSLKHGAFVRVKYRTDVQPSAKFKGHKIEKIVEQRLGLGFRTPTFLPLKKGGRQRQNLRDPPTFNGGGGAMVIEIL